MADISPTTATSTFSDVANARAKVWKETFKKFASTADVLSALEGPEGSGASIAVRNDIKGRRGDRIEFTASSELGAFGVLGEGMLKGNEESLAFSGTTCTLEFKRHATALTQSLKKKMAGGHTLESLAAEVLGNHFGQWKQRDALRRLIDGVKGAGASATAITAALPSGGVIANNKADIDELLTTDTLGASDLVDLTTHASWLGVDPARITRNGYPSSQDTYHHCLLADNQLLRPLFKSGQFQSTLQQAELRGATNPLFTGDLKEFDGTKILNMRAAYGDLKGPIGSPLTPAARLKASTSTIVAGEFLTAAQGSGSDTSNATTDPKFFIDFPGYDYNYTEEQSTSVDGNVYYVAIFNPDGGKLVVSYDADAANQTGNTGTAIEVVEVNPSSAHSQFDATSIQEGAMAFPCTSKGVPYAYSILMGADSLIRAYGEDMRMTDDSDDYGFRKGIGYQAMFGDAVWKDRNNRVRNYVLAVHAYNPIGVKLADITS